MASPSSVQNIHSSALKTPVSPKPVLIENDIVPEVHVKEVSPMHTPVPGIKPSYPSKPSKPTFKAAKRSSRSSSDSSSAIEVDEEGKHSVSSKDRRRHRSASGSSERRVNRSSSDKYGDYRSNRRYDRRERDDRHGRDRDHRRHRDYDRR